jgi:hypothetical protein
MAGIERDAQYLNTRPPIVAGAHQRENERDAEGKQIRGVSGRLTSKTTNTSANRNALRRLGRRAQLSKRLVEEKDHATMKMSFTKLCLSATIAVCVAITPLLAASTTPAPTSADVKSIVDTANAIAARLPSRTQVAAMPDEQNRLFMTKVLDQNQAAQRADKMTPTELAAFAADVQATGDFLDCHPRTGIHCRPVVLS